MRATSAAVCARRAVIWSLSDWTRVWSAACCSRATAAAASAAADDDGAAVADAAGPGAALATPPLADAGVVDDADAVGDAAGTSGAAVDGGGSVGVTLRRSLPPDGADDDAARRTRRDDEDDATRREPAGAPARRRDRAGAVRAPDDADATRADDAALRGADAAKPRGIVGCTTLRVPSATTAALGAAAGGSSRKTYARATGDVQPTETTSATAGSLTIWAVVTSMRAASPLRTTRLRGLNADGRSSPRGRTWMQLMSSSGAAVTGTEKRSGSPRPDSSDGVPRPSASALPGTPATRAATSVAQNDTNADEKERGTRARRADVAMPRAAIRRRSGPTP